MNERHCEIARDRCVLHLEHAAYEYGQRVILDTLGTHVIDFDRCS